MKLQTTKSTHKSQYKIFHEKARGLFESMELYAGRFFGEGSSPFALSGAINISLLMIIFVTGLLMLLNYNPTPQSIATNTHDSLFILIRGIHRAAADILMLAILIHGLRMWATSRFVGPRSRAWTIGILFLPLMGIMGWSGYILRWDPDAFVLLSWGQDLFGVHYHAIGRILTWPIFGVSNPADQLLRIFMLHIGGAIIFTGFILFHLKKLSKPKIHQPLIVWGTVFIFVLLVAVMMPVESASSGTFNPLNPPSVARIDIFLLFPLLFDPGLFDVFILVFCIFILAELASLPTLEKHKVTPAVVIETFCTGCGHCYNDCPYDAIEMVPGKGPYINETAKVISRSCTSCGICVGSCEYGAIELPELTSEDIMKTIWKTMVSKSGEEVVG